MKGLADETVGSTFSVKLLEEARDKTLEVILQAAKAMTVGTTEAEAKSLITEIQTKMGAPKSWHPPQIRFGKNTLLPFGVKTDGTQALQTDDIFFFDIGPLFAGHEGDVGRPFTVGSDPEMAKCCVDAELIWKEVRDHWKENQKSGAELYDFAKECAKSHGWILALEKANGHRIADFPHAAQARGSVEEFPRTPASHRWILEIQIRHPSRLFGAFFEDLLS